MSDETERDVASGCFIAQTPFPERRGLKINGLTDRQTAVPWIEGEPRKASLSLKSYEKFKIPILIQMSAVT